MKHMTSRVMVAVVSGLLAISTALAAGGAAVGEKLAAARGCTGGMGVVCGAGGADLALGLAQKGKLVVQALYAKPGALAAARKAIQAAGVYGPVSADRLPAKGLPYAENLINVIVVDGCGTGGAGSPAVADVPRVLSPLGTAYFGQSGSTDGADAAWVKALRKKVASMGLTVTGVITGAGTWVQATKPYPADMDQWTHYLHDSDGNPVAADTQVGPPVYYRWLSGPMWLRSHESDSSVRAIVTAAGRLFSIVDEAPASVAGPQGPPDEWSLRAQDAFNGTVLWRVPIKDWGWRAWKPSWFTPRPGVIPLNIDKRVVAIGDKVYATLGYKAPLSQLDANTGRVLQTYKGTKPAMAVLYHEGTLVLGLLEGDRLRVVAVRADDGKRLWATENTYAGTTVDYYRFTAMHGRVKPAKVDPTINIATDGNVIGLLDGANVVCLDFATGEQKWSTPFPTVKADEDAGRIKAGRNLWVGTMICRDGVLIHASPNNLAAFSAKTGKVLWQRPKRFIQHLWYEWKDVYVIDGLVWTWGEDLQRSPLSAPNPKNPKARRGASLYPVHVNGYDLHTGEVKKQVPLGLIFKANHHHRCYRNMATTRYILASRRGTEFVDLKEGKHSVNNWIRGTCHVGMVPANGLQYAPPHPCQCYIDEKLNGLNAVAAADTAHVPPLRAGAKGTLERGPAYGKTVDRAEATPEDWPAFRADGARTGGVATTLPARPKMLWTRKVGSALAAPIAVGPRIYVPLVDEHQVVCLRAADGAVQWRFTAGGRIDSPPTYWRGRLLFGSADGWAYCLRAADGALVWRYRAGPIDRRMAAFGQLESVWPVHGSVLVVDGTAYFSAGRTSHLDGGILLCALDAATGQVKHRIKLAGPSYGVEGFKQNYGLPMGYLADILQQSGSLIFLRDDAFDKQLTQQQVAVARQAPHISAPGGFTDDSYFKRIPWRLTAKGGGYARLVVHDPARAFGLRMFDSLQGLNPNVYFTPGRQGYLLFAASKTTGKDTWKRRLAIRGRAMVAARGTLAVAGPPDRIDPKDPLGSFEGRLGGVLALIDPATGKTISEQQLPSPPVFNGAAAARGRLYLSLQNGTVMCFGK